jgi:hypothetical protein
VALLHSLILQLWGFLGTTAFVTFMLHIVFFTIGFLGNFPSILTNYIWPALKDILIGILVVQSLTITFRIVAAAILVFFKQVPSAEISLMLFFSQTRDRHIIHQRLFSIYDVSAAFSFVCVFPPFF